MSKLIQKANDISTKNKLLISYFFAVLIPVVLLGVLLTVSLRNMAMDGAVREVSVNMENVKERIAELLKVPIDISNIFYADKKLGEISTMQYTNFNEYYGVFYNYKDFEHVLNIYRSQIYDVRFYTSNKTMVEGWPFFQVSDRMLGEDWYRKIVNGKGKAVWNYIYNDYKIDNEGYYLALGRQVFFDSGRYAGVVCVIVNQDKLNSILREEQLDTMIVNGDGIIVAAKDHRDIGKHESLLHLEDYKPGPNHLIRDIEFKGKPSKIIVDALQMEGADGQFKLVSVYPIGQIYESVARTTVFGYSIMGFSLILSIALIFLFSNMLSRRLKNLSRQIQKVESGDFDTVFKIQGKDEVGRLAKHFNHMVRSLREMVTEVYEANLQKKQLELKQKEIKLQMLSNQMNPHFLFNTLETIRMQILCKGDQEVAGIVKMLGNLLRRNLETRNDLVPLSTELTFVKEYLEIQRFRFGDKIDYEIRLESGLEHRLDTYPLLPFVLQPIVENAVIHGLEGLKERGMIVIRMRREGDCLLLTVRDNGLGLTAMRLKEVSDSLEDAGDSAGQAAYRVGLRNVHQRIRLYYGDDYGLSIGVNEQGGALVAIRLPWEGTTHV